MPHQDIASLREEVSSAAGHLAQLEADFAAIAARRNASESEVERLDCAAAAGRVGSRLSDAERRLKMAKAALAEAEGDEYRQSDERANA